MGALAGWVAPPRAAPEVDGLAPMLEKLEHRARAAEMSAFVDRREAFQAVLGATLYDAPAGVALALDGAIGNRAELRGELARRGYRFPLGSDEELLLRAYQHWDKDVVKRLRGAFAFALWDSHKGRLVLARDRFGEKPLYLREANGVLWFASEARALAAAGAPRAEIDLGAVWEHLACRYVPAPRTLLAGIRKLAPASIALWQFRKLHESRYWVPPDRHPLAESAAGGDPVEGFIERLGDAVKLQMPEEAPAGAFLSGGVDSAAIVALMVQDGRKVHTYTIGVEGDRASELAAAAAAAKHFGTQHHEVTLAPRELVERLPRLVAARDAPLSRPSDAALHLLAGEAAKSVRVVLTGEGGDEILGGYRRHAVERFAWMFRNVPTLLALAAPLAGNVFPKLRTAAASFGLADWRERAARWNGLMTPRERERFFIPEFQPQALPETEADPAASRLRRMLYFDQVGSLPDNLLERDDRMTMAVALEARAPFLDHRLAEYVSRLPDAARVRGLETKWILRRALARLVPARTLRPQKAGWLPERAAALAGMSGALRELAADHLRGNHSLTRAYYEPKALERAIDAHAAGRGNNQELLWTLLNLEIWHRQYHHA
jgi:asparagine synthase (glutamine-hydrolysing)